MVGIIQKSKLRGSYRLATGQEISGGGISTSDAVAIIKAERPNPISVVWEFSGYNYNPLGISPDLVHTSSSLAQTLSTMTPGTLYVNGPTPGQVNVGIGFTQLWLKTDVPQAAGVENWVLVSNFGAGSAGAGGGSGDGQGGGGGGDE